MKDFGIIYRQKGIRTLNQFLTTRVNPLVNFEFPKRSLFHYYTLDDKNTGPDDSVFYIKDIHRRILVENMLEYIPGNESILGNTIYLQSGVNNRIRNYFFNHKKFRLFKNPALNNTSDSILSMVNYSFIPGLYRYLDKPFNDFYKWYNLTLTIINKINIVAVDNPNIHQFLFINVAENIPALSAFHRFIKINHQALEVFNNDDLLMVRDIFNWLFNNTEENVFSNLTVEALETLNLIFMYGSKFYLINAYYLWSFNKDHDSDLKLSFKTKGQLLAKMFLNSLILLKTNGFIEINPDEEVTDTPESEEVIDEVETDTGDTEDSKDSNISGNNQNVAVIQTSTINYFTDKEINKDVDTVKIEIEEALKLMNENIEVLDKESRIKEISFNTDFDNLLEQIKNPVTPNVSLNNKLKTMEEFKILTGSELANFKKKIDSFNNIVNPYTPDLKLSNSTDISKEDLVINPEKNQFKDNNSVLDKTMLRSTMVEFDKQYLENTLHKDILNMVKNIQHAGIIIDDYKIEPTYAVTGDYETHILKVHPIGGQPSTLYFKLPIINDNGEWTTNNIKYRQRKQRGDMPIKKISPDKVALTSYYNKIFVERDQKKANSLSEYLFKYIFATGIQKADNFIYDVKLNDVFDNEYKCPRLYSALAMNFSTFSVKTDFGNLKFNFNHKEVQEEFKDVVYNIKDYTPVGSIDGQLLLLDKDNNLYKYNSKENVTGFLDNFYTILKINKNKIPLEFNSIKIFTKDIPLVLILGHYVGIDNILKLVNADYDLTDINDSKEINSDNLVLYFKDKVLTIPKSDKESVSILAGLLEFNTAKYNYKEFNKTNVYFNLLAELKLNTI